MWSRESVLFLFSKGVRAKSETCPSGRALCFALCLRNVVFKCQRDTAAHAPRSPLPAPTLPAEPAARLPQGRGGVARGVGAVINNE